METATSTSATIEASDSNQAAVTPVPSLTAADDTVTPKTDQPAVASTSTSDQPQVAVLPRLSTELDLDILWNKLSACLNVLKSLSDPYAVLILQQTVEGFFYVHATRKDKDETKKRERETKETQLAHLDTESGPMSPGMPSGASTSASTSTTTSTDPLKQQKDEIDAIINSIGNETSLDTKRFLEFALTHRTVLNHILRQTSNNLSEEPYSVLVDFTRSHTHILDFDVKRRYFRQELDKLKDSIRGEDLAVHVRRTNIFDDSYRELNRRSTDDWKHRFYIVFEGEEGQDAGGLLREW
jgi:E3 ubiquitin-protein ligase HUWE1